MYVMRRFAMLISTTILCLLFLKLTSNYSNGTNEVHIDAFDENNDLAEDSQIVSEIEVLDESGDTGTIRSQED